MSLSALTAVVQRLMETLVVAGPAEEYAQLLSQHVSSEALSAVSVDLILRRLRERAPRVDDFDARYHDLKARNVRELDRTMQLLQKLSEDKAVMTMLGDGSLASIAPSSLRSSAAGSGSRTDANAVRPLPHQRSSAAADLAVSTDGPTTAGPAMLTPDSMRYLQSLTLTPDSCVSRHGHFPTTPHVPAPAALGAATAGWSTSRDEEQANNTLARGAGERGACGRVDAATGSLPTRTTTTARIASSALAGGGGGCGNGPDGRRAGRAASGSQHTLQTGASGSGVRGPSDGQHAEAAARAAELASRGGGGDLLALGELPTAAQESVLVQAMLSALLGIQTEYISMRTVKGSAAPTTSGAVLARSATGAHVAAVCEVRFALDATLCAGIDPALSGLVGRMLPLCAQYVQLEHFALAATSQMQRGLVAHALGASVRELLREYLVLVAQLEEAHGSGADGLTLQSMWWYVQPALQTLAMLDQLCVAAAGAGRGDPGARAESRGGVVLAAVCAEGLRHAGTAHAERLFAHVLHQASEPLFAMLSAWLTEGRCDDPYGEFFISQNSSLHRSAMLTDYNDRYWQLRFTMRDVQVPPFLRSVAQKVLAAGKYVHVLRECHVPLDRLPPPPTAYSSHEAEYESLVSELHAHVSRRLLEHMLDECALLPVLRSLKHYLLLEQGDFFVHFLDIAEPELVKDVDDIAQGKLNSFLELALRASTAAADPYRDRLSCKLLPYNLTNQLLRIVHSSASAAPSGDSSAAADGARSTSATAEPAVQHGSSRVPGLDAFTFEFAVEWPLSIVISRHALVKYQLLFRHLFQLKHVERQLGAAWLSQQGVKELPVARALFPAYSLRQRMLHLLHNLQHYMVFEVIEPRWHALEPRVRASHSVDEVISHHHEFLDSCLKECMLRDTSLLQSLARLLTICVKLANCTAVVMASVEAVLAAAELSHQNVRDDSVRAPGAGKQAMPQGKRRQLHIAVASTHIRAILAEKKYSQSVLRYEDNFMANLTELIAKLQLQSAKDGMLANLIARLDFNGFYDS